MSQIHHSSEVGASNIAANIPAPVEAEGERRFSPLWRNRDYMLLWSGQLISSIGGQVSLLAFPLLVLTTTHSPAQAGVIGALLTHPLQRRFTFGQISPALIRHPASGACADRGINPTDRPGRDRTGALRSTGPFHADRNLLSPIEESAFSGRTGTITRDNLIL
ncbi:MAG TPA: hypothetical protein VKY19_29210 [Ktedonosporobacter sp.]|nr:hypothetical protein [Ktedonosporobacter sp.]